MARTPSDICDTMGFTTILRGHGWLEIIIALGNTTHAFTVTEIFGDPVSDLVDLCRGILTNTSTSIFLPDEPGCHVMSVTKDELQQHIMTFALHHRDDTLGPAKITGDETLLFAIRVKRRQLLGLIMTELWKNHHFMLEPSFQKSRSTTYPHAELKALNQEWDAHPSLGPSFLK